MANPNSSPCTLPNGGAANFKYHNGQVLSPANFRPIFWGSWWSSNANVQSQLLAQLTALATSPAFTNRLREYNVLNTATIGEAEAIPLPDTGFDGQPGRSRS